MDIDYDVALARMNDALEWVLIGETTLQMADGSLDPCSSTGG